MILPILDVSKECSFSFAIHYVLLKILLLIFPKPKTVIPVREAHLHTVLCQTWLSIFRANRQIWGLAYTPTLHKQKAQICWKLVHLRLSAA